MNEFEIKYNPYNTSHTKYAQKMRKAPTQAEKYMWEKLLRYKPLGYKFTRQKPIGPFIADFYCAKLLLIIELD
jgi:very-short-patch-repair endonuclease